MTRHAMLGRAARRFPVAMAAAAAVLGVCASSGWAGCGDYLQTGLGRPHAGPWWMGGRTAVPDSSANEILALPSLTLQSVALDQSAWLAEGFRPKNSRSTCQGPQCQTAPTPQAPAVPPSVDGSGKAVSIFSFGTTVPEFPPRSLVGCRDSARASAGFPAKVERPPWPN